MSKVSQFTCIHPMPAFISQRSSYSAIVVQDLAELCTACAREPPSGGTKKSTATNDLSTGNMHRTEESADVIERTN